MADVSQRHVRRLLQRGEIALVRIGRLVRIPEESIEELFSVGYRPAVKVEESVDG